MVPYNGKQGYPWVEWLRSYENKVFYFDEKRSQIEVIKNLESIINENNIDIIHSHFGYLHKILSSSSLNIKVRIIIHDHMDYNVHNYFKQYIRQIAVSLIYKKKRIGIISVMEKKNKGYWICGKYHWYIPNGLSLKRNVDYSVSRKVCRKKLGIKDDEVLCLFLGWDIIRKGLDIAIKAIENCRNKKVNIVLGIVGFGDDLSEEMYDKISSLTGIDSKKAYLKYLPSVEDMFAYHEAADIYLSASRKEAFSYVVY